MLNSPSDQLFATEWRPPANAGWQMNIFFGWLLLFIPLVAISPRRLSLLEWVWFLSFGWLALSGLRYVIWFMFIMASLSGALLGELLRSFKRDAVIENSTPAFNYVLAGLIFLLPLMMLPGIREAWWKDAPAPYHAATTPIAAIITATPTNVVGSLGCTPNRSLQRRRLEPNVACVLAALMAATHPLHHGL